MVIPAAFSALPLAFKRSAVAFQSFDEVAEDAGEALRNEVRADARPGRPRGPASARRQDDVLDAHGQTAGRLPRLDDIGQRGLRPAAPGLDMA